MNADPVLYDADLMAAFEGSTLAPQCWNHRAHVRVAYLYASLHGFDAALMRMRAGLTALNAAHRTPETVERGYHETMTVAFMRLIFAACRQQAFSSSAEFCDAHPELMTKEALLIYYSRERLVSGAAKQTFVEPDLLPLAECWPPAGKK